MIYVFDLDGTLCTSTDGFYEDAAPFVKRIEAVNVLYDAGHTIMIDTARGQSTGIDWYDTTARQLKEWGVKYHTLRVGTKISADFYVDDKAITANVFFEIDE